MSPAIQPGYGFDPFHHKVLALTLHALPFRPSTKQWLDSSIFCFGHIRSMLLPIVINVASVTRGQGVEDVETQTSNLGRLRAG